MPGRRIDITGVVQGVGFRPWVARLARAEGLVGSVRNHAAGVTIEAAGSDESLARFLERLRHEAPAAARLDRIAEQPANVVAADFAIVASGAGQKRVSVPPDLATCPDCLAEILDPADRRHGYAFTNCTACGPRFTVAVDVPWDRPNTSMAGFPLCADCASEYGDEADRRYHAEPIACPTCGPRLSLLDERGAAIPCADPIAEAATCLQNGGIVAIKGLGGFHLACDATNEEAVLQLRQRKHREAKPLAVMVAGPDEATDLAFLGDTEWALLQSTERPIVLARRHRNSRLAPSVAPDTQLVGLLLPYTPLHHLLVASVGLPLVMTSGNRADEPIAIENDEAVRRLSGIADRFLVHDRPIASRCDDSVARAIAGAPVVMRRARGWVPRAIPLPAAVTQPILACGAQLKNTFCLAVGDQAVLGPHGGDLDHLEAFAAWEEAIERMERFLGVRPEVVAHDLHPDYLSTRYAEARPGRRIAVQHHHAHAAAALAEHGLERALALTWDGTGLGPDGSAWGGELLLATRASFERVATFRPVRLAGGERAIREPWRVALALVDDAMPHAPLEKLLPHVAPREIEAVRQLLRAGVNSPAAHGVGRLFDAAGSLVLGLDHARYEGQVAMALEAAADPWERAHYPFAILDTAMPWQIDLREGVRALVSDRLAGLSAKILAARWHETLVAAGAAVVRRALAHYGSMPVVGSGGCFQNARLAAGIRTALGGRLSLHREVPPGDGGIALGQVVVAAAAIAAK